MTYWAMLADIHGNRRALEAVIADASKHRIERWINLGDCFFGPLDPAGTAELLRPLEAVTVLGNQDRDLLADNLDPRARAVVAALQPKDLAWLAKLPATTTVEDWFLCHGTPRSDLEPLLEMVTAAGSGDRPDEQVEALLDAVAAPYVACGHTHVHSHRHLPSRRQVLNPGSVGLPAYTDDSPHPHAMESGTPHARYALLERRPGGGWRIEPRKVTYDWEGAARQAERGGRPDWARWLRTGLG
ncbi:MAG: metallophosphoesterase family protein [Acidobacteriota bacterium]